MSVEQKYIQTVTERNEEIAKQNEDVDKHLDLLIKSLYTDKEKMPVCAYLDRLKQFASLETEDIRAKSPNDG